MSFEETRIDPTTQTQETGSADQHGTQPSTSEQPPTQPQAPAAPAASPQPAPSPTRAEKEPSREDFATALETFEQEQAQTEAALNDDHIMSGTVLPVNRGGDRIDRPAA